MASAGFGMKPSYHSEEDLQWFLERRSSVNDIPTVNVKLNKGEKETMKRWLSIISEDKPGHNVEDEEYNFDFMESESEDESTSLKDIKLEEKDSITTIWLSHLITVGLFIIPSLLLCKDQVFIFYWIAKN